MVPEINFSNKSVGYLYIVYKFRNELIWRHNIVIYSIKNIFHKRGGKA